MVMPSGFEGGEEILLAGGSMTTVVRVGDTVRRPTGRWTPAVHSLLQHLEDVGFEGAPRVLGFDDQGREVLTYLPSEPAARWSDDVLIGAAHLVRRLHDALDDFVAPPRSRLAFSVDRATGARWPDRSQRPQARQHRVCGRSAVRLH